MRVLKRPAVLIGGTVLAGFVVVAVFAPLLVPHDPNAIEPSLKFIPPVWTSHGSWTYPLGTDQLGRDVLSRLMFGARTSLLIAGSAVTLAVTFGGLVGLLSGYVGGVVDTVLMRIADVQLAFPFILLALAFLSVTESKSAVTIILVLAVASWVIHARVARSRVLVERESDYVRAARTLGASHRRIMFRYILPSIAPTMLVIALLELATAMVVESILAFVGLGIDPPAISWGLIMAEGRRNIAIAWWMLVTPGAAIFLAVFAVNLIVDGVSDVLDPRRQLVRPTRTSRRRPAPGAASAQGSPRDQPNPPLLAVQDLQVSFTGADQQTFTAVNGLTFDLHRGQRLAIVGESGSGKSMTALAILGLVPPGATVTGSISFDGRQLVGRRERDWRGIRGRRISMISQNPGTALNPVLKVGYQLTETIIAHGLEASRRAATARAAELLRAVNIADVERVMSSYPFEISGGMQQRAMIAIALSTKPDLLIADEPTTALDVTTQAQILVELDELVADLGTSVLLISHDVGVVAGFAERTIVMYAAMECETGATMELLETPHHPYTQGLVEAVRSLESGSRNPVGIPGQAIDVRDLTRGCPFANRCPARTDLCDQTYPELRPRSGRRIACHHPQGLPEKSVRTAP